MLYTVRFLQARRMQIVRSDLFILCAAKGGSVTGEIPDDASAGGHTMPEIIRSNSNQRVRALRELLAKPRERRKRKCFVAEGLRMVSETPPERIEELYISESFLAQMPDRGNAVILDDRIFRSVSDTQNPQGILAVVRQENHEEEELLDGENNPLLLFLENIQDPGNLGTMVRTAEGAGVSGLILSRDTVDIYNPKVVRATMGSLYRVPFAISGDMTKTIRLAQNRGIQVYAAWLEGSVPYTRPDYRGGTAFLIGNEGSGLRKATAECASECIRIPMQGSLESLNAAVAASVLMYEAVRQRMSGEV